MTNVKKTTGKDIKKEKIKEITRSLVTLVGLAKKSDKTRSIYFTPRNSKVKKRQISLKVLKHLSSNSFIKTTSKPPKTERSAKKNFSFTQSKLKKFIAKSIKSKQAPRRTSSHDQRLTYK